MQILINKHPALPKEALPDLTPSEEKYLLLLEFHNRFPKKIREARKKLKLKVTVRNGKVYREGDIPDQRDVNILTDKIITDLNIPEQLGTCINNIIEWGQVLTSTRPINIFNIEHQVNRRMLYSSQIRPRPHPSYVKQFGTQLMDNWYASNKKILETAGTAPAYPLIQINKKLNSDELKQAIDDNWPQIEQAMTDFEKSLPYFVPLQAISAEELKYSIIIYRMRNRKNPVPHKIICERLQKKYKVFYEESTIRQKSSDFEKLLKRLGFIE